jgi:hypothetical protein
MEQRRIARNHLYADGSCWPSNFGLVTSEPRARTAVISFLMFEHDGMPCTAVSYSARCEISETQPFCAFPSPKISGVFLIFCIVVECEFSRLYVLPQLVFILSCTFVQIRSLARPCISNLAAAGSSSQICRDHLVTN